MKRRKFIFITLILFMSVGFAVLSSNLNIGSAITIREAFFDVHFENVVVDETTIENDSYLYNDNNTEISFSLPFDKPGDYIDYKLYVVNGGTIDASINTLNIIIPDEAKDYVSYTLSYYNGDAINSGDLLRVGTNMPLKLHIEYNYNIDNFIEFDNITLELSLSYKQPQSINTKVWNFDYEDAEQVFIVPKDGNYKIEVWGAQGGSCILESSYHVGYGGYSVGTISLNKNNTLYINVGQSGTLKGEVYAYNGGGASHLKAATGGGATHIALKSGLLFNLEDSIDSIIIVAGGGGGAERLSAGSGGGYIGGTGSYSSSYPSYGTGGTQGSGGIGYPSSKHPPTGVINGSFGKGGEGFAKDAGSGGGGGYYGGGGSTYAGGAGGGSGYIGNPNLTDKIMYCFECQSSENETTETDIKTRVTTKVSEIPTSNYAKMGHGYARITYIG